MVSVQKYKCWISLKKVMATGTARGFFKNINQLDPFLHLTQEPNLHTLYTVGTQLSRSATYTYTGTCTHMHAHIRVGVCMLEWPRYFRHLSSDF